VTGTSVATLNRVSTGLPVGLTVSPQATHLFDKSGEQRIY